MRGRMNSPNFALSVTAPKHNVSECPATALPVHATPVALPDVRKATGDRKSTNTDASSAIFIGITKKLRPFTKTICQNPFDTRGRPQLVM
jgi:hypothetical protein